MGSMEIGQKFDYKIKQCNNNNKNRKIEIKVEKIQNDWVLRY